MYITLHRTLNVVVFSEYFEQKGDCGPFWCTKYQFTDAHGNQIIINAFSDDRLGPNSYDHARAQKNALYFDMISKAGEVTIKSNGGGVSLEIDGRLFQGLCLQDCLDNDLECIERKVE
jgi:spermidine/putrescine-binding protein